MAEVTTEYLSAIPSFELEESNKWRVPFIKELIDIKAGNLEVTGFEFDELEEVLDHICTD